MDQENARNGTRFVTGLTILMTFLMGFVDSYTYIVLDHVFVSAQTGNMVTFGVKLFSGEVGSSVDNVISLAGFASGAYIGEILAVQIKQDGISRYRSFLYMPALLLFLLALFQMYLANGILIAALGILSGYSLTLFRKIGMTDVNNGIMTGNTKNIMNRLYLVIHEKSQKAKREMISLLIGVLTFVIGVCAGTLVNNANIKAGLWTAFAIVCVPILFAILTNRKKQN